MAIAIKRQQYTIWLAVKEHLNQRIRLTFNNKTLLWLIGDIDTPLNSHVRLSRGRQIHHEKMKAFARIIQSIIKLNA